MKLLLINFLCFLIIGNTAIGQNNTDITSITRKYWYYKSRLNNDFVKVGLNQGESMPFNQRGRDNNSFNMSERQLNLGDGASTLGYYVALLATEYRLLVLNAQSTTKVKHELFCALNAINRIDAVAESADGKTPTPLNGFFIRDDIPGDFLMKNNFENYYHFNYYNAAGINNNSFNSKFNKPKT